MSQILDNIPLKDLSEDHLTSLVLLRVPESARIEYKAELKLASGSDKREFCKDVTAMANSLGGLIFFGIAARNGVPTAVSGIDFDDNTRQQLHQVLSSAISPRVQSIDEFPVPIRNKKHVLALKVEPDGYLHQVKSDDDRFYKRTGTITVRMESSDVETFFKAGRPTSRLEEVMNSIEDYYATLRSRKYFKGIQGKGLCTICVVPEVSSYKLDMSKLRGDFAILFQPIYSSSWDSEITGRSRLTFGIGREDKVPYAATEVTELGEVKAYNSFLLENRYGEARLPRSCIGYVPSLAYEREVIIAAHRYLTSLKELGISAPFFLHTGLINVRGYILYVDPIRIMGQSRIMAKDDISPELIHIQNDSQFSTRSDVAKTLRPAFDFVWREFGFERSFSFSSSGEWDPEK